MCPIINQALQLLRQPGRKPEVHGAARTLPVHESGTSDEEKAEIIIELRPGRLDRWLDHVVDFAGSQTAFFGITGGLLVWALLGIKFGETTNWQVIISDVQALLCYIYDSFLTRQQLNAYAADLNVIIQLRSRSSHNLSMMKDLVHNKVNSIKQTVIVRREDGVQLPKESRFGRAITSIAAALGHISTLIVFWIGVIIWLGFGPMQKWDNSWQLYMNSATSALMVFTFALLANISRRHSQHTKQSLEVLFEADSSLEVNLRSLTHNIARNEDVVISAPTMNRTQRAIFYYADLVGTLTGIAILTVVICVWVAIGPALQYDSNWWLLIGTYAGLIGMFDAFILRNMQAKLRSYTDHAFGKLHTNDAEAFELIGKPLAGINACKNAGISIRISQFIDKVTTHELTVVAALFTMFGLIVGSSVMKWSLTGQLLSNVPPSIIESWLMLVLITGHNLIEDRKRQELQVLLDRRLDLLGFARALTRQ